jgi:ferredoxin
VLPLPEGPEAAEAKQLVVDWVRCQGHGLCAHLVPELVHLDKTGFPVILPIPVPPWLEKNAQHAVQMCPALALRLDTDPKKRGGGAPTPPIPVSAPTGRTSLLGERRSITAG